MSDSSISSDEPVSYILRFRERALRDIDAAYVRFAEVVSESAANAWHTELMEAIAALATFPRRCPPVPEPFRKEVRQLLFRRSGSQIAYRVLFTISGEDAPSPDPPTVTILHVRHAAAAPITRTQMQGIESSE